MLAVVRVIYPAPAPSKLNRGAAIKFDAWRRETGAKPSFRSISARG